MQLLGISQNVSETSTIEAVIFTSANVYTGTSAWDGKIEVYRNWLGFCTSEVKPCTDCM